MKKKLLQKVYSKEALIGVVGLGYVGLPLAVEGARAGFKTIGFDIEKEKVKKVNEGINYIRDVIDIELKNLAEDGILSATNDFSLIGKVDFIMICVPTPLDSHQEPDISFVKSSAEIIAKYLKPETMVILESTTYPGTTEELLRPILEEGSGLECGKDFYLAFSPERVDPGNLYYKTKNTPKVVGGVGEDSTKIAAAIYRNILDSEIFEVSSPAVAEMEKILENIYRNINIGLINELAMLCNKMHLSIWEVIEAAKTKPYGFQAFYPGPGLGGHCIPLDPYYLSWKARESGFHISMIESSMMINDKMPEYCVSRAVKILNRMEKPMKGSKILVVGIAYKQDIDDYRESPAIKVINLLRAEGAEVSFFDPYISEYQYKETVYSGVERLTSKNISENDLIIITTAHTVIDYGFLCENAKMVFDTKNVTKNIKVRKNIEVL